FYIHPEMRIGLLADAKLTVRMEEKAALLRFLRAGPRVVGLQAQGGVFLLVLFHTEKRRQVICRAVKGYQSFGSAQGGYLQAVLLILGKAVLLLIDGRVYQVTEMILRRHSSIPEVLLQLL